MRAVVVGVFLGGCFSPTPRPGAPCANGRCPDGLVCSPATNTCERDAVPADALVDAEPTFEAGIDATVSAFAYRRRLTITNASQTTLPIGFTIRVPLAQLLPELVSDGKVKADHSDLRLIGDGAIGERDRIVDVAPAPLALSFALALPLAAGSSTTAYALYYGAPNAMAAPANGASVFPVYDEFTNSIAASWQKNDGPATAAGKLVLRANRTDAIATTAATDGVPIISAIELVANVPNPNSEPTVQTEGTFYYWFGYQRTGDFTATDPWSVWIARGRNTIHGEQKSPVGCEMGCGGADAAQGTAARHYAIERDPTVTRFYLDGTLSFTATVTNNTDYSVMIRNYMQSSELHVDWIRARARVSPDPSIAVGPEQNL